jgi:hypothetical protein
MRNTQQKSPDVGAFLVSAQPRGLEPVSVEPGPLQGVILLEECLSSVKRAIQNNLICIV